MNAADPLSLVITPRTRDLGGFSVRRALPDGRRRMVGPFIFFDHMGPAEFAPGQGIDVRPHPHIALATVTFLFEGEILHRDSLGSQQAIRPGDVNWMLAGRGLVHSERTGPEVRRRGGRLHGIQSWVALPRSLEDTAPSFVHHPSATIPRVQRPGVDLRVVAGTAYGQRSPVSVLSPTLYVAATLDAGATLEVDPEHPERAAYVLDGRIVVAGRELGPGTMAVFNGGSVELRALAPTRLVIVGGTAVDGERHIWWNFVASSVEQMERAKQDWHVRNLARFPNVPGDEQEYIPLPEDPSQPIHPGEGKVTFNP